MNRQQLRGRFAPSPSGQMHLGNAWTALWAWLQIRQAGGTMVLRIEDLDPERSRAQFRDMIMADLRWLGLDWDEGPDCGGPYGPYEQSRRRGLYDQALAKLKSRGLVYPCFCTRADIRAVCQAPHEGENREMEYPGTCRYLTVEERAFRLAQGQRASLRCQAPERPVVFVDSHYGLKSCDPPQDLDDFIVQRSDGVHAYQLAVVVDDALMGITHVLRGADLITSTYRQIVLYNAIGWPVPQFAHVPLLNGPDGYRLSKRHGDVTLQSLRAKGVHPENIVGVLAYWAGVIPVPEPVRPSELISRFDLHKLPLEPIIVDYQSLTRGVSP